MPLDRGTRIYLGVLIAFIALLVALWAIDHDWRAGELSDQLQQDPEIAAFPFPFRVITVSNGVAVVSSPRSASFSALHFLAIIDPQLANLEPDDPAVIAAQKHLARIQGRVAKRLMQEPDIERIRWQLDQQWFNERGVRIDN